MEVRCLSKFTHNLSQQMSSNIIKHLSLQKKKFLIPVKKQNTNINIKMYLKSIFLLPTPLWITFILPSWWSSYSYFHSSLSIEQPEWYKQTTPPLHWLTRPVSFAVFQILYYQALSNLRLHTCSFLCLGLSFHPRYICVLIAISWALNPYNWWAIWKKKN